MVFSIFTLTDFYFQRSLVTKQIILILQSVKSSWYQLHWELLKSSFSLFYAVRMLGPLDLQKGNQIIPIFLGPEE